ncbi:hypothetical protein CA606_07235 [Caulobacter vibrioides]|uniref:Uncharacterized protein n=1 Tax=Caulobacter vibrioides TaxID=155892 RepID=A0A290MY50_CAUVI|nr:hypothetical protein [Caulobacter vibrioides]ATC32161.1 hypothetical protein CA606_07235 [Caulobacter vibrioides]
MNKISNHEPPSTIAVFHLQLRKIGRVLRPELVGLALLLSPMAILGLALLMRRDAALDYPHELNFLLPVAAFLLPYRLWTEARLFDRGDFQVLPVERRRHVLIGVCAGLVWALGLAAAIVLLFNLLALAAGSPTIGTSLWQWLVPLGGVATAYLLGSGVVLALRHSLRWSAGVVLACVVLSALDLSAPFESVAHDVFRGDLGLERVLSGGASSLTWGVALSVWLALGLAVVALASLRHREG